MNATAESLSGVMLSEHAAALMLIIRNQSETMYTSTTEHAYIHDHERIGEPLGIITSIVSAQNDVCSDATPQNDYNRGDAVIGRFLLQSAARDLLPRERVAVCLRYPHAQQVDVWHVADTQSAHYGGLMVCGSIWQCPACAAKVSERRRVELTEAVKRWHDEPHNGAVIMVTLTLRHQKHESLQNLVEALKSAWRAVKQGAGWKAIQEQYAIAGIITALEVTHGQAGWHPHLHALVFVPAGLKVGKFAVAIKRRWLRALERMGSDATWKHGCDVRTARKDVADYVAKFGREPRWTVAHELTKAVSKKGHGDSKTPIDLLTAYITENDQHAGELWRIYAITMSGRNQLTWTRGLRKLLDLADEKTDEEIAKEREEHATRIATLTLHQWKIVLANDARGELLQIAARGDELAVHEFLIKLGVLDEARTVQADELDEPEQLTFIEDERPRFMTSSRMARQAARRLSSINYATSASSAAVDT